MFRMIDCKNYFPYTDVLRLPCFKCENKIYQIIQTHDLSLPKDVKCLTSFQRCNKLWIIWLAANPRFETFQSLMKEPSLYDRTKVARPHYVWFYSLSHDMVSWKSCKNNLRVIFVVSNHNQAVLHLQQNGEF